MPTQELAFDAVVVGAGTAGANAAFQLADRGLSVALVERRTIGTAGAQWDNGVLDWQFERAGLAPPSPPERHDSVPRLHLFGPEGDLAIRMDRPPTVSASMGMLGERLHMLGTDRGVISFDRSRSLNPIFAGDRLIALMFHGRRCDTGSVPPTGESIDVRLAAEVFVDASGRSGVLRRESPLLKEWCPTVRAEELCSASDFCFAVADGAGAERFLERHGAGPGESVSVVGLTGGFSTRSLTVSSDLKQVSVLVGCLASGRYGTGPEMIEQVRRREPWIGERLRGGSGVIPLRRPYPRFTAPGLALVGDSACQVFPAHGSGIGMGLIAGRMLADAIVSVDGNRAEDLGDESTLWRYQREFCREFGGTLAAFDSIRRMSTSIGSDGVTAMIRAGLMTESMVRSSLDQTLSTPETSDLPAMVMNLARRPRLAAEVLPLLARGRLAARTGVSHPDNPDVDALRRWDNRVQRLLGPVPG